MDKYYQCTGIVNYSLKDGWITILLPDEIANYYSWFVKKAIWKGVSTPLHGCHCTLLPAKHNGDYRSHPFWGRHQGEKVQINYESKIYTDNEWFSLGRYFWLRVQSDMVGKIRQEFGLPPELHWPLHSTICYCDQ
jgi:hypothetical protein